MTDFSHLAARLTTTVHRAGRAIMAHYGRDPTVQRKADASPVTAADQEAEALILSDLHRFVPEIAVISEEAAAAGTLPSVGSRFFLVDPLDGTKEFIKERSDFTINIALIEARAPRFGIIYAPARAQLFLTVADDAAMEGRLDPAAAETAFEALALTPIRTREPPPEGLTAVVSRSHLNTETEAFLRPFEIASTAQAGSSLKFCLLARGSADIYPRLARTMEWDTAAGDAILRAAGGIVLDQRGAALAYGKRELDYANPGFVAWGRAPRSV